jgi:phosphatidylglycerol:prolipoprotein diacylglycerol transferase
VIPILFETSFLSIQSHWVFVVIAMFVSTYLSVKRLKRRRLDFTLFIKHSTAFFVTALIVSRIVYFATNTDAYFPGFDLRTLKNLFSIWDQGFSFWGAVLGFFSMMYYHIRKANEPFWKWMDALSVPVLVGMLIGYIGMFLGGYSYGIPSDLPWAIQYESFNVKYTVPVHPTQIYYIISISLILWSKHALKKKNEFFDTDGNGTLYCFSLYFLGAFLLEFLRGDDTLLILGIRLPIFLFGAAFLVGGYKFVHRINNYKSKNNGSL